MLRPGGLLPNPSRSGGQTVLDGPAGGLDPAGAGDLISNSACPELAACRWWQTLSEGGGGGGRPPRPEGQLVLYTLPRNPYDPPCSVVPLSFGKEKLSGHIELANLTLTLPTAKAGGFSVRRHVPPSEVLQCLLERSLLRGGSRVPHGTCPHPGHLTTCQVVQVDRRAPRGSLATLGP
jgi:hypothetical protein